MHKTVDTALRWAIPLTALLVVGPLVATRVTALHAVDGGPDTSLLVAASPAAGILAGALTLALSLVMGAIAARLLGFSPAVLAAGFVLVWGAWVTGEVGELLRREPTASTPIRLAIEGALVAGVALAMTAVFARMSRVKPHASGEPLAKTLLAPAGLASVASALVAGIAAAWIVARTDMRGQAIFAAFGAGIAGAVAARLIGTAIHQDAPPEAAYIGVALAAALAPLITLITPGASGLVGAALAGDIPGAARLQPLDWAIAVLWGVPTGLSWVGDLAHQGTHAPAKPA